MSTTNQVYRLRNPDGAERHARYIIADDRGDRQLIRYIGHYHNGEWIPCDMPIAPTECVASSAIEPCND